MLALSKPYCDIAYDGSLSRLSSGQLHLFHIEIDNPDVDDFWLQLFDAEAIEKVELGVTPPTQVYLIPGGDGSRYGQMEKEFTVPVVFAIGLLYAITTTPNGDVLPTDPMVLNFQYRPIGLGGTS